MSTQKKERIEIRMPDVILTKIDAYQAKNGLTTRTAAILELIRLGLAVSPKK